ncbi:MAG: nucleotidyltransferase domain-containing protein [Armatimonadetes bacterium]|nr:nucleotidyltransferase domain-containing protein [Armatimonadota bacterium]
MGSSEAALADIRDRIVARFRPRRIVLFGSHARAEADEESDFDILVEMDSDKPPPERSVEVNLALMPRDYALDVLVYTPAEVRLLRRRAGSFLRQIEAEGRVLYDRAGSSSE